MNNIPEEIKIYNREVLSSDEFVRNSIRHNGPLGLRKIQAGRIVGPEWYHGPTNQETTVTVLPGAAPMSYAQWLINL